MSARTPAVEIHGLTISFGDVLAVDGLDLEVAPGEVVGLLGRNGAGKTSTVGAVAGLVQRRAGHVAVFGHDPATEPDMVHALLSLQPQQASLFPRLTVEETLELWSALYADPMPVDEALDLVGLQEKAQARAKGLSGGQAQRLLLATAFIGRTPLVVLDEPSTGLDPHARRDIWSLVRSRQAQGTTVLITTHDMDEAAQLCDRVAIVHRGRMHAVGTPSELVTRFAPGGSATVWLADAVEAAELAASVPGATFQRAGDRTRVELPDLTTAAVAAATGPFHSVTEVRHHEASLEDAFLRATDTGGEHTSAAPLPARTGWSAP
jgi:ABC-2 type transport system ATP-binding protein